MSFKSKFSNLGQPRRVWVVGAVCGQLQKLQQVHRKVFDAFVPGDRLVYTGNMLCGRAADPLAVVDDIIALRRALLSLPGAAVTDIVHLRGMQEDLWHRIQHLQFEQNAKTLIAGIAEQHPEIDGIVRVYGGSLDELARTAREGIIPLTKWSLSVKTNIRQHQGHEAFYASLRRAAFTDNSGEKDNVLFVSAGVDTARPFLEQEDSFWRKTAGFNQIEQHGLPFRAIVRGFDPDMAGVHIGAATRSLDGGAGRGGKLVCATMSAHGDVLDMHAA